jgi:peptidoglycan/xylan/chitin deacetylase (PgdA/CDA1 family)
MARAWSTGAITSRDHHTLSGIRATHSLNGAFPAPTRNSMRQIVKAVAERTLLRAGPAALYRRLHRGRSLVFAYHNVVPEGEAVAGDTSLHLPRHAFARQLDQLLEADVEVVTLDELMNAVLHSTRADPIPRVAITFDDGYRGAVQIGVEELARRGLPATFFVVPGLVGDHTFWWDALSASGTSLKPQVRKAALDKAQGRDDKVMAWARRQGLAIGTVPEHARSASEAELRAAAIHDGIQMASHTWSHPNLAQLNEEDCRSELERAAAWLRERFGAQPQWLSYPYGLHGEAAERAMSASSYKGAFRIEGGWLPRSPGRNGTVRLPRLNIPAGLSSEGFALRLSGLLCGRRART